MNDPLAASADERLTARVTPFLVLHHGLDLFRGQDPRGENTLFKDSEGHGREADEVKDATQFLTDVFGVESDVLLLQGSFRPGQSGLEEQLLADFQLLYGQESLEAATVGTGTNDENQYNIHISFCANCEALCHVLCVCVCVCVCVCE